MDGYIEDMIIFLIMFSSTLFRNATLKDLNLDKSENIKDFLEILNPFFSTFFFKVVYRQRCQPLVSIWSIDKAKKSNFHIKRVMNFDRKRVILEFNRK